MAVGYLLLNIAPGKEISVREAVSKLDCVSGIWIVFGLSLIHISEPTRPY